MREILTLFGIVAVVGFIGGVIYLMATAECVSSHTETQIEMPMGVVVGKSEYFGGISVPMGNAKYKEVEVCDEYK